MANFKTRFPNGGPNDQGILQAFYQWPGILGNAWFVNSVAGAAGNGGTAPDGALDLIATAQTKATASNGDVVFLCPGHVETVSAAYLTLSKAGILYQGLGQGRNRPTLTWNVGTSDQIIVSGANITFRNIVFDVSGFDAIVAAFSVTGADVAFEDCDFILQAAASGPLKVILTAATAARFRVERCRFLGLAAPASASTCTACISHEVGIDFKIKDCYFRGKMTQAILNAATILGGVIDNCQFHIYTGTKAIALAAGTTGLGVNNRIIVPSGTAPIVGAGFTWIGNIYGTEALTIGTPTAAPF